LGTQTYSANVCESSFIPHRQTLSNRNNRILL